MALGINIAQHLKDEEEAKASKTLGSRIVNDLKTFAKESPLVAPRAIEGLAQSTYNLADTLTGDRLPDWDNRLLGKSESVTGGLVEGILQWAVPYTGSLKAITTLSKVNKMDRLMKPFTTLGKAGKVSTNWKGKVMSEVAADFIAFNGHEERLSNLIQSFPALQNPLTEYLAAGPDDGEIEGRFKNALEGLGIGGAIFGLIEGTSRASKLWRHGKKEEAVSVLKDTHSSWYQSQTNTFSPTMSVLDGLQQKAIKPELLTTTLTKSGKAGIKEELTWMGLSDPDDLKELFSGQLDEKGRIKVADLKEILKERALQVEIREIPQGETNRLFEGFRTEGGTNYREFTLTVKGRAADEVFSKKGDANRYASTLGDPDLYTSHFDATMRRRYPQEEVLLHFRTTERSVDGGKALMVEELQSDFFQSLNKIERAGGPSAKGMPLADSHISSAVRQIVKMAVDEGYNKVVFPNGEKVAALYNTTIKDFSVVEVHKDGGKLVTFKDSRGKEMTKLIANEQQAETFFGKKAGKKLWETGEGTVIPSQDVNIDSTAFINQYDRAMTKELNKLGRTFGTTVEGSRVKAASFGRAADDVDFARSGLDSSDSIGLDDLIASVGQGGETSLQLFRKSDKRPIGSLTEDVITEDVLPALAEKYGFGEISDVDDLIDGLRFVVDEDTLVSDVIKILNNTYHVRVGASSAQDFFAHSFDITANMADSLRKSGVPLWGLPKRAKSEATDIGGVIADPALLEETGMGLAQRLPNVLVKTMELKGVRIHSPQATVKFALDRLGEGGTTPEVRGLAKGIIELFGDDIDVMNTTIATVFDDVGALGSYDLTGGKLGSGRIDMFTARASTNAGVLDPEQVFKESTLLHEIVHATAIKRTPPELGISNIYTGADYIDFLRDASTSSDYDDNIKGLLNSYLTAVDNMPEKYRGLLDHLNDLDGDYARSQMATVSEWYGFINFDEFITEALTNRQFQNFLKTIKGSERKTLWETILEHFKKLIGADAKGTLLEDVIDQYTKISHKLQKTYTPRDYGWDKRVLPSRSTSKWLQKTAERREQVIVDALDEIEIDPKLRRGGSIALTGVTKSIKEVSTADDLGTALARTEQLLEAKLKANPKLYQESLESAGIHQAIDRLSEMSGAKKDVIASEVAAAQTDADALRRIAARLFTIESFAVAQADEVFEAAQAIAKAKPENTTLVMKANLVGALKKMMALTSAGSNLRRGFGQGLQSTQIGRTKLSLDQFDMKSVEIINEFMANNSGHDINKIVNMILNEGNPQDTVARMLGIAKTARGADPQGFFDYVQNWYVNSLLSGPRTMVKNGIGNALAMTLLNVESAVGGVFTNPQITRMVLKEMMTFESFRESINFFLKTWKNKDQLLDVGRSPLESTAKTQAPVWFEGGSSESTFKAALNWVGENIVNAPSRTLASMDEVFKQTLFRQNVKMELTLNAMNRGINRPDEIAEYVASGLDAVLVNNERAFSNSGVIKYANEQVQRMNAELVKNGQPPMKPSERGQKVKEIIEKETQSRIDKLKSTQQGGLGLANISDIEAIAERGLDQARYGTFTNDAGLAAEMAQGIVTHLPILKVVFPFIRTPVNLLKFSFDRLTFASPEVGRQLMARMPDLPMLKSTQQEIRTKLNSRNQLERAQAHGKIATAAVINSALLYTLMSNRDLVTGGGPKSFEEKQTLQAAGWQPYSFRIGNKYYSFGGLDPIGTHIGVLVDMIDQMEANSGPTSTLASQVFAASTLSLARNVTDKSYLAGLQFLTDALSEPDRKLERAVQNIAGGFVPNILYQGQSIGGDTTVYEVRSLADAIFKKLPNGQDDLDPKRNLLGEKIIREQIPFIGPFNPAAISTRDGDVVFEELAQLEHGFGNPNPVLDRLIDLTEYTNSKGQTAHDRRLELMGSIRLRGKNLRQAMTQLIERKDYQKLSSFSDGGFKSPRVAVLNKVLSRYRKAALAQMMTEFPELRKKYVRLQEAKQLAKSGGQDSAIESLLKL